MTPSTRRLSAPAARVCAQSLSGRLGIATAERLPEALADGALDDFTIADLTRASLADAHLTAGTRTDGSRRYT